MSGKHTKEQRRTIRHRRVRRRVVGTQERPRLSVFRSGKHIYAQLVDDSRGHTLATASSREAGGAKGDKPGKVGTSFTVGQRVAERARAQGVTKVCFDRGGYLYHGRVKALAEGARDGGLDF